MVLNTLNTKIKFTLIFIGIISFFYTVYFLRQSNYAFGTRQDRRNLLFSPINETFCRKWLLNETSGDGQSYAQEDVKLEKRIEEMSFSNETLCSSFKNGFPNNLQMEEEMDFPIAFTFAIHKDLEAFARLFRAIHRPSNVHCIHIDAKASEEFVNGVQSLVNCVGAGNTHILGIEQRVDVVWSCPSNFYCHFNCARFLVEAKNDPVFGRWKYLINMPGQEFPLRTNLEMVRSLKTLNGKSLIENTFLQKNSMRIPKKVLTPFEVNWAKGSVYVAASRDFMNFALTNEKALQILEALKQHNKLICTNIDEMYYSTLYYDKNLNAPGSLNMTGYVHRQDYLRVFVAWYGEDQRCFSKKFVRGVCIFGLEDLPNLIEKPHIGANKFYSSFQPEASYCLEKWLAAKVLDEHQLLLPDQSIPGVRIDDVISYYSTFNQKYQ